MTALFKKDPLPAAIIRFIAYLLVIDHIITKLYPENYVQSRDF